MVDQNLLTTYLAVVTLAILIQTGVAAGLYFASMKMTRQADRAVAEAQRVVEPVHRMVAALESASVNLAEFSSESVGNLRQVEARAERTLLQFRRRLET